MITPISAEIFGSMLKEADYDLAEIDFIVEGFTYSPFPEKSDQNCPESRFFLCI